jgi:hypothetical protein
MAGDGTTQQQQPSFNPDTDPRVLQTFPGQASEFTIPQAMPNQLEQVAAQLASGYGPGNFLPDLDALYAPTTFTSFGREGSPAATLANLNPAPLMQQGNGMADVEKMMGGLPYEQWASKLNSSSRMY